VSALPLALRTAFGSPNKTPRCAVDRAGGIGGGGRDLPGAARAPAGPGEERASRPTRRAPVTSPSPWAHPRKSTAGDNPWAKAPDPPLWINHGYPGHCRGTSVGQLRPPTAVHRLSTARAREFSSARGQQIRLKFRPLVDISPVSTPPTTATPKFKKISFADLREPASLIRAPLQPGPDARPGKRLGITRAEATDHRQTSAGDVENARRKRGVPRGAMRASARTPLATWRGAMAKAPEALRPSKYPEPHFPSPRAKSRLAAWAPLG